MATPKFLTRYNHANPKSPCGEKTMTSAQFARECDINCILEDYKITGALPPARHTGDFIDCSKYGDFADAIQRVTEAKAQFAALPSTLRDRFGNDPVAFYNFVMDDANLDECVKLGLRERKVIEKSATDLLQEISDKVTPRADASTVASGSTATTT